MTWSSDNLDFIIWAMRDAGLFFRQNIAAISSSQLEEEAAKAIVESMENFHVNYGFIMSRRASQIETKDHVHVATVCSNGNLIHRLYIFLFFSSCFFFRRNLSRMHLHQRLQSHTLKCINSLKYLFIQTNKKMRGKNRKKHELKLCSFETKTKNRGIESFLTWNCKTVNFKLSVYLLQP